MIRKFAASRQPDRALKRFSKNPSPFSSFPCVIPLVSLSSSLQASNLSYVRTMHTSSLQTASTPIAMEGCLSMITRDCATPAERSSCQNGSRSPGKSFSKPCKHVRHLQLRYSAPSKGLLWSWYVNETPPISSVDIQIQVMCLSRFLRFCNRQCCRAEMLENSRHKTIGSPTWNCAGALAASAGVTNLISNCAGEAQKGILEECSFWKILEVTFLL